MLDREVVETHTLAGPGRVHIASALVRTVGLSLAAVVCAEYVYYFATLRAFPLQDFPNHLARATVIADLLFDHGARFGETYTLSLLPVPYVLHDLLFATLIEVLGVQAGGACFAVIVVLSLPFALLFYMRITGLAPRAKLMVFVIGLYLATDFFFQMAFMGFRLGLAVMIVSLGILERLRRQWSRGWFCVYVVSLAVGYLIHLASPMFFAIALGVSTVLRLYWGTANAKRELWLWLPLATLLALHFGFGSVAHSTENRPTYDFFWGTWRQKFQHIWAEFTRYGSRLEGPMLALLAGCLLLPLRRYLQWRRFRQPQVLEPVAIAVAFGGFYFISPQFYADSAFVDVRALPVVLLMILLACLNVPGPKSSGAVFGTLPVLVLAFALAAVNFVYLVRHVGKNEASITQYRQLGAAVPVGAYVLPVHTIAKDGEVRPLLHAAAYLVADRGAVIPYLFSGDRGDPMKYFRYRARPYWPAEDWYVEQRKWRAGTPRTYRLQGQDYTWRFAYSPRNFYWEPLDMVPVDWNRVACRYDFLLMTLPADMSLIGVPTHPVRANDTAALVAVDKSVCRPELVVNPPVQLSSEHLR
jgi:hypothetical protein